MNSFGDKSMAMTPNDADRKASPPDTQDEPKNAAALDRLQAKLSRLNREAEQLGDAMRQKPQKA
jgi:hypothetical protein